jgi:1-acyl-sn-glycerol-3-phosphate acyltransferase
MFRTVFVHLNTIFSFLIVMFPQLFFALVDSSGDLAHNVGRFWGRWLVWCGGIKVTLHGRGNILRGQPQIFFCTHKSYFDVFCLLAYFPVQYRWLAKEELFHLPLFGRVMRKGGYIPIDRSNSRKAYRSMVAAAEKVRAGTSLVIFPEGTRSPDGRVQPFKTGGAALAIQAQVPVVPVAIVGTDRIMPKGSLRMGNGYRAEIRIGKPISTAGLRSRDKSWFSEKVREAVLALNEPPLPTTRRSLQGAAAG